MKKNTQNTLDVLTQYCSECMGSGEVSSCCGSDVEGNRCTLCNKFCRVEVCMDCNGQGFNEYRINDEVEIFVCVWSPEYLRKSLYDTNEIGDTKTFRGKIIKIIDDFTVEVKVKWNGIHKIKIDDITTI